MIDLTEENILVKTEFLSPPKKCMNMSKSWMTSPIKPNYPNNFEQIRKNGDKFTVMWGHEQFIVETKIERKSGMIISAKMDNTLSLKVRINCDETLKTCQHEMPLIIQRDEVLKLQE